MRIASNPITHNITTRDNWGEGAFVPGFESGFVWTPVCSSPHGDLGDLTKGTDSPLLMNIRKKERNRKERRRLQKVLEKYVKEE